MSYGKQIRARRIALELTQAELGQAIGKNHKRVSDYESDRVRPDAATTILIQKALGFFVPEPSLPDLPTFQEQLTRPRGYLRKGEKTTGHRLNTAAKRSPVLQAVIEQLTRQQRAVLEHYACDSCWEAGVLALLIVIAKARLGRTSPLAQGFFEHVVLHPLDELPAGHIRFPALLVAWRGRRILFIPQVPLKTTGSNFTVDFLVGVSRKGAPVWRDMEVDGEGHDYSGDDYRGGLIHLRALRFRPDDICAPDFVEKLLDALIA